MTRILEQDSTTEQRRTQRPQPHGSRFRAMPNTLFDDFSQLMAQIAEEFNAQMPTVPVRPQSQQPEASSRLDRDSASESESSDTPDNGVSDPTVLERAVALTSNRQETTESGEGVTDEPLQAEVESAPQESEDLAEAFPTSLEEGMTVSAGDEVVQDAEQPIASEAPKQSQTEIDESVVVENQSVPHNNSDETPQLEGLVRRQSSGTEGGVEVPQSESKPLVENSSAQSTRVSSDRAPRQAVELVLGNSIPVEGGNANSDVSTRAQSFGVGPISMPHSQQASMLVLRDQILESLASSQASRAPLFRNQTEVETGIRPVDSVQASRPGSDSVLARENPLARFQEAAPLSDGSRSSRAATRSNVLQNFEKVESALKELARSHDGKSVSIKFDPPELGTVRAEVHMRDGALHARLVAESPLVNQLLRERALELQGILRRLGLDVDRVTVAVGSDNDTSNWEGAFVNSGESRSQENQNHSGERSGQMNWFEARPDSSTLGTQPLDHWIA